MVDFIRDVDITALVTANGARAFGDGDGEAGTINQALNGGIGAFLNKESGVLYTGSDKVLLGQLPVIEYEYDFDKEGGALGEIELKGKPLPAGFTILGGVVYAAEAITSAGSATVSVGTKTGSTTNLLAATAKANLDTGDKFNVVPDLSDISTAIREATSVKPIINVATAALTGGKLKVVLIGLVL
jgi:hypothetical protein